LLSFHKFGKKGYGLALAVSFFIIALIFREIDYLVCPIIPIGSHFLWHIFNSIAGFLLVRFIAELHKAN
jgi:hypothetical protein